MNLHPPLDAPTLFVVNATSLLVFSVAYLIAYSRGSYRKYWVNLSASNLVFAAAFLMFSQRIGASKDVLLLPNCLLVIGLGFRWQAVRAFFGHQPSYLPTAALAACVAVLLYLADTVGTGTAFGGVNVVIALQLVLIMYALASEPARHLPSRWGLVAAYGVLLASSALRVLQGWMIDNNMDSLLPADVFLNIHLFAAAIHIVGSGAFALSMAYEQGALDLHKIAMRDPLTGLPNRLGLDSVVETYFRSVSSGLAIFVIDIDHFKQINDRHGHAAGDLVIRCCGSMIGAKLRETDFVARVGGEEFLVIVQPSSAQEAYAIAERIRIAVESGQVRTEDAQISFTVSIGVSYSGGGERTFTDMTALADAELYRAKRGGRNQVRPRLAT